MLNQCNLMGRLTRDPEMRRTGNGIPVTSFTIAVDRDVPSKENGERKTDFFDCVAWRATGEFIAKYFRKGSMIIVNARAEQRQWTDKEGNKRNSIEFNVESAYFGEGKKQDNGNNTGNAGGYGYAAPTGNYAAPPAPAYGAPAPAYGAPAPAYSAPAAAPAPGYSAPAPAPAPAPGYSAPAPAPAPVNNQQGAAVPQYGAAPQNYAAPSYGYQPAAPASDFAPLNDDDAQLPF